AAKSRSRGVFALAVLAFSTASQPRFSAAGGGGDQIWVQLLMATPQYAIAQSGSACATAANALGDSGDQNEGRSATAPADRFCTAAVHQSRKRTRPLFSGSAPP